MSERYTGPATLHLIDDEWEIVLEAMSGRRLSADHADRAAVIAVRINTYLDRHRSGPDARTES
jgi:hypothetical protein